MPLTQQKHYTVGYHDSEKHHFEICEYAADSYEAIEHSKEDVPYLKQHPSFIDYCNFIPTQVDKHFYLRACGIPFGC
tara:strand:+ start:668 stop:898 length:231 start_codon:yes stop_codon:yes gene_type:complete